MVLPFRAADAGVDRQHYHVHVGDVATLERDGHAGEVLRSGGAHAHALEVLRAIALGEVVALAARLLERVARLGAIGRRALDGHRDVAVGNLCCKLLDDLDGLDHLGRTDLHARVAVAVLGCDQLEVGQVSVGTVAEHAHVVVDIGGAGERPDH